MSRLFFALAVFSFVNLAGLSFAQDQPMEFPKPEKEHDWLQKFVGNWESISEANMGEGQPPIKNEGTIKSRMLGGFWVVNEMDCEVMGTPMTCIQTVGFDETKKKYVGTWVDSVTNHMWHYEGSVDETGKILTLEAEGPNFMEPGKSSKFRDIYEFKSEDEIIAKSSMQGDDGEWTVFMQGTMTRKSDRNSSK